jgi:hypothetical protein
MRQEPARGKFLTSHFRPNGGTLMSVHTILHQMPGEQNLANRYNFIQCKLETPPRENRLSILGSWTKVAITLPLLLGGAPGCKLDSFMKPESMPAVLPAGVSLESAKASTDMMFWELNLHFFAKGGNPFKGFILIFPPFNLKYEAFVHLAKTFSQYGFVAAIIENTNKSDLLTMDLIPNLTITLRNQPEKIKNIPPELIPWLKSSLPYFGFSHSDFNESALQFAAVGRKSEFKKIILYGTKKIGASPRELEIPVEFVSGQEDKVISNFDIDRWVDKYSSRNIIIKELNHTCFLKQSKLSAHLKTLETNVKGAEEACSKILVEKLQENKVLPD